MLKKIGKFGSSLLGNLKIWGFLFKNMPSSREKSCNSTCCSLKVHALSYLLRLPKEN